MLCDRNTSCYSQQESREGRLPAPSGHQRNGGPGQGWFDWFGEKKGRLSGLTRAFFYAGARSVMATHGPAESVATVRRPNAAALNGRPGSAAMARMTPHGNHQCCARIRPRAGTGTFTRAERSSGKQQYRLTPMNQFAALKHRQQTLRHQCTAALRAMNYELALRCQMEIDDLQRELNALDPHVRLMIRQHQDYYREKAARLHGLEAGP